MTISSINTQEGSVELTIESKSGAHKVVVGHSDARLLAHILNQEGLNAED